MDTVLVPIDGSPAALRALAYAVAELAGRSGGIVHLLNVQAPLMHAWPSKLISPDVANTELRQQGSLMLGEAQALLGAAGVDCSPAVRVGAAAEEIVAHANECGCSAIVMGTRGMGTVAGLVLGSVAQGVVRHASMPVTLVK